MSEVFTFVFDPVRQDILVSTSRGLIEGSDGTVYVMASPKQYKHLPKPIADVIDVQLKAMFDVAEVKTSAVRKTTKEAQKRVAKNEAEKAKILEPTTVRKGLRQAIADIVKE